MCGMVAYIPFDPSPSPDVFKTSTSREIVRSSVHTLQSVREFSAWWNEDEFIDGNRARRTIECDDKRALLQIRSNPMPFESNQKLGRAAPRSQITLGNLWLCTQGGARHRVLQGSPRPHHL